MPVFVKAHRRGRSLIKAYSRNKGVMEFKQNFDQPYGSNLHREARILSQIHDKVVVGNALLRRRRGSTKTHSPNVIRRMVRNYRGING